MKPDKLDLPLCREFIQDYISTLIYHKDLFFSNTTISKAEFLSFEMIRLPNYPHTLAFYLKVREAEINNNTHLIRFDIDTYGIENEYELLNLVDEEFNKNFKDLDQLKLGKLLYG